MYPEPGLERWIPLSTTPVAVWFPVPVAGMSAEERYALDLRGYLVRPAVLGRRELAALHRAVDALGVRPGATVSSPRFSGHLGTDPAFRALIDHPAVLDVVRELCGAGLRLDHTYGIVMAPGTRGLDLHGGAVPFDPAQFYVADASGLHTGLVAALWSLVDSQPGDGGFACIPGSHKAAFARPAGVGWDGPWRDLVCEVPLRAGDVLVFTEALTHGTLPWAGRSERRVLAYKYSPGSSAWAPERVADENLGAVLTERQRLLAEPPYVARRRPVS